MDEMMRLYYGQEIENTDKNITDSKMFFSYMTTDGLIVSRDEWIRIGNIKLKEALQKIPDSAFQTYSINTKEILAEYKGKTPEGKPMVTTVSKKAF